MPHPHRLVVAHRDTPVVRHRNALVVAPFLFAPHLHRLARAHRDTLVVADGLRVVHLHVRRPVVQHLRVHVLLRMDIHLLLPGGVIEPQLVEPASPVRLRPDGHLRLRPRQASRRTVVLMVRPPHYDGLVRVPVQEVHYHLLAHPRYRQVAETRTRPRLRHPYPA